jgi:BirA family biotin operon repressor/biotin-[acetyl-CoA-carboxylase] ligase
MTILHFEEVTSTLDVAHEVAAQGAEAGTLIVADTQTAGRGRQGRSWTSEKGAGIWLTMIERPRDASGLDVLSLRVGIALADALDAYADAPIWLKWPNDLYIRGRKLAGILIEARWREGQPEWVAIGVGINLRPPASEPKAIGLRAGTTRDEVLDIIAEAIHRAAQQSGTLTNEELSSFAARDLARGHQAIGPVAGTVQGIDASGALLVSVGSETVQVRAGSLVLEEA